SPNPTTGSLFLGGLSLSSIRAITVMDASGRIVSRPAPQRTIDLGTHQNGWYLVELELTDGRHLFERVVLNR
ncbi:MAG: T9SS type A sorting domain-containing protein, partial [Flavobacteriales bacterium]|nr:T9SS type A sorting domain-containing protein [Flavobacteriales bacterium]MCB9201150.1 T9SS type A sorting domain-containing protein [Flavobacteriales bacterium]